MKRSNSARLELISNKKRKHDNIYKIYKMLWIFLCNNYIYSF